MSSSLTSQARPKTSSTLTVRIIKSLRYRTEKSIVLHGVDLTTMTVGELKKLAIDTIASQPGWKPYRNVQLDTLKLYTKAHGSKTSNLIINLDHDEWILEDDEQILAAAGFENETEVSFFNRADYEDFKVNPQTEWDT